MPDYSVDSLKLKITSDTSKATQGIDKLRKSLINLEAAVRNIGKLNSGLNDKFSGLAKSLEPLQNLNFKSLNKGIKQLERLSSINLSPLAEGIKGFNGTDFDTDKFQKLANTFNGSNTGMFARGADALAKLGQVDLTPLNMSLMDLPDDAVGKLQSLAEAMGGLSIAQDLMQKTIRNAKAKAKADFEGAPEFGNGIQSISGDESFVMPEMYEVTKSAEQTSRAIEDLGESSEESADKVATLREKLRELSQSGVGKAFSSLGNIAKRGLGLLGTLSKALAGGFGKMLIQPIKSAGKHLGELVKKFQTAGKKIAGTVGYWALFQAITAVSNAFKQGLTNLNEYAQAVGGTLQTSLNSIATNMQYLKNSIGALAAPLINAIAPALDYIVDKVVSAFNVISQIIARLTGASTWTRATKAAATFGNTAGSAGKAAKNAGKAAKTMAMAFDELNVLKDSGGSGSGGGGGGGGGSDAGAMFEEVPIDSAISGWVDQIKNAIEAGDWYGAGSILADKVNEMIDQVDWEGWGHKLGAGLEHGIELADGFLATLKLDKLGAGLATSLNGVMDEVDFTAAGRVWQAKWKLLFDMAYGFINTFDWAKFGVSVGNFINGSFEGFNIERGAYSVIGGLNGLFISVINAAKTIKWTEIGQNVGKAINDAPWRDMFVNAGTALSVGLKGMFTTLINVVQTINWVELGTSAAASMNAIDWIDVAQKAGQFIGEGLKSLASFVGSFMSNADWFRIGAGIAALLESIDWIGLTDNLLSAAKGLASGTVNAIKGFFLEDSNFNGIPGWMEAAGAIANFLLQLLDAGVKELVKMPLHIGYEVADWIAEALKDMIDAVFPGMGLGDRLYNGIMESVRMSDPYYVEELARQMAEGTGEGVEKGIDMASNSADFASAAQDAGYKIGENLGKGAGRFTGYAAWINPTMKKSMVSVGENAVVGFQKGIENKEDSLKSTMSDAAGDGLLNHLKTILGIQSPSTEMEGIGENTLQGLINGLIAKEALLTVTTAACALIMTTAFTVAWTAIKLGTTLAWSTSADGIIGRMNAGITAGNTALTNGTAIWVNTVGGAWTQIKNAIPAGWAQISASIKAQSEQAANGMKNAFENAKGSILAVWDGIKSGVQSAISDIISAVNRMSSSVSSAISSMNNSINRFTNGANQKIAQTQTKISEIKVPKFASGGYPNAGELFLAREAGPELVGSIRGRSAVANNDQIVEGIRQGVYEAVSAAQNGNQGGTVEVKLYIDGRQVAASVEKAQRERGATIYPGGVLSGA